MSEHDPTVPAFDPETTCKVCFAEFLDAEDLQLHTIQVHCSNTRRTCDFCPYEYEDVFNYCIHIRDCHLTDFSACKFCYKIFTSLEDCTEHSRKHVREGNTLACSQCEAQVPREELADHEYENHDNNQDGVLLTRYYPELSSVLCFKVSTFLLALGSKSTIVCIRCGYSSTKVKDYRKHLQTKNCKSLACQTCSSVYSNQASMSRHFRFSLNCGHNVDLRRVLKSCPGCKKLVTNTAYKSHIKTCKVIKCWRCNLIFSSIDKLTAHQSKEHPLACQITTCKYCSRECVGKIALHKHIERAHLKHLHLYKYLCTKCNTAYKHPQKLFGHYFSTHKDLSPYTCKICDKTFKIRKKFTIHIKLDHKSEGFVEFDSNYHVFFTKEKSENPFVPSSLHKNNAPEEPSSNQDLPEKSAKEITYDYTTATENEGNVSSAELLIPEASLKRRKKSNTKLPPKKRKLKLKDVETISVYSSDEEPLTLLQKRGNKNRTAQLNSLLNRRKRVTKNQQFTCKICNKYCYTYQNYHNHVSMHKSNKGKECIKCGEIFKTRDALEKHISNTHSSSKLTDTLKSLLAKRDKYGTKLAPRNVQIKRKASNIEKIKSTIKKVKIDANKETCSVTIKPVTGNNLSVQKFIENFTPDGGKDDNNVRPIISISTIIGPARRRPIIKMTKFQKSHLVETGKLSMPVKFNNDGTETTKVTVKLVNQSHKFDYQKRWFNPSKNGEDNHYNEDNNDVANIYDNGVDNPEQNEAIPEVAEEVLLEGTEETTKQYNIVLPKLSKHCPNVHIAHLQPQAPFYKIVSVKDVLKTDRLKDQKSNTEAFTDVNDIVTLPDGTKLVTSNPLAHLLSNVSLEKVLSTHKKCYQPKNTNFKGLLTKALMKLENPQNKKKQTKK